ncbi:MAG TPA: hypothetical protein VGC89_02990 [Pyrinomonadaceae bacterium]|jgi:hypothetical protein
MTISLKDIPDAVKAYLNNNVTVNISNPTPDTGNSINPQEGFTFRVVARNANLADGGIDLTNVRYRVESTSLAVAGIRRIVSAASAVTDLNGHPFPASAPEFVVGMIVTPSSTENLNLGPGDADAFSFRGKAGAATTGGHASIRARILADVDQSLLFPKNEDSPVASVNIDVVG